MFCQQASSWPVAAPTFPSGSFAPDAGVRAFLPLPLSASETFFSCSPSDEEEAGAREAFSGPSLMRIRSCERHRSPVWRVRRGLCRFAREKHRRFFEAITPFAAATHSDPV